MLFGGLSLWYMSVLIHMQQNALGTVGNDGKQETLSRILLELMCTFVTKIWVSRVRSWLRTVAILSRLHGAPVLKNAVEWGKTNCSSTCFSAIMRFRPVQNTKHAVKSAHHINPQLTVSIQVQQTQYWTLAITVGRIVSNDGRSFQRHEFLGAGGGGFTLHSAWNIMLESSTRLVAAQLFLLRFFRQEPWPDMAVVLSPLGPGVSVGRNLRYKVCGSSPVVMIRYCIIGTGKLPILSSGESVGKALTMPNVQRASFCTAMHWERKWSQSTFEHRIRKVQEQTRVYCESGFVGLAIDDAACPGREADIKPDLHWLWHCCKEGIICLYVLWEGEADKLNVVLHHRVR